MQPKSLSTGIVIGAVFFTGFSLVFAWTGPTASPPNGNVSPPINTGSADQVKNGGLGINSLAVFGSAILAGTSRYLNFNTLIGESGYGFRDNAGTLEFKNSGGSWNRIATTTPPATPGPDWSSPISYDAGGSSNRIVITATHKICVLSTSGDSGCGRCGVYRNNDGTWSVDSASCSGRSHNWCSATCFD